MRGGFGRLHDHHFSPLYLPLRPSPFLTIPSSRPPFLGQQWLICGFQWWTFLFPSPFFVPVVIVYPPPPPFKHRCPYTPKHDTGPSLSPPCFFSPVFHGGAFSSVPLAVLSLAERVAETALFPLFGCSRSPALTYIRFGNNVSRPSPPLFTFDFPFSSFPPIHPSTLEF